MILFLGDYEHQYYIEEAAAEMGEEIQGSGQNLYHVDALSDACMSHDGCDIVVINIEAMTDIPQDIGDALDAVREETGAILVIMDIGASLDSETVGYLYRRGYRNFITSSSLGIAKEQARKALRDEASLEEASVTPEHSSSPEEKSGPEGFQSDSENEESSRPRIIAVAGCGKRMGTTTLAIQCAVFLATFHKRAAVLEQNNTGWVHAFADLHRKEYIDSERREYDEDGVKLFEPSRMAVSDFSSEEFDTLILDCGSIRSKSFPREVFLNSDVQMVTFGCKPGEGMDLAKALAKSNVRSMFFLCLSAPGRQQVDIMTAFGPMAKNVYFVPWIPSPFDYNEDAAPMIARILKRRHEPFQKEWEKELVTGTTQHPPVQPKTEKKHKFHWGKK